MLRWPNHAQVDAAVRTWAAEQAKKHPGLRRLGYFGSYARGNWGVGSDLDLVAVVDGDPMPFDQRATTWDLQKLPVPAELLVYTDKEWQPFQAEGGRFARMLADETIWVYTSEAAVE